MRKSVGMFVMATRVICVSVAGVENDSRADLVRARFAGPGPQSICMVCARVKSGNVDQIFTQADSGHAVMRYGFGGFRLRWLRVYVALRAI